MNSGGNSGEGCPKNGTVKTYQRPEMDPFQVYFSENQERIESLHPKKNITEVTNILIDEWKDLPKHVKQQYVIKSMKLQKDAKSEINGSCDKRTGENGKKDMNFNKNIPFDLSLDAITPKLQDDESCATITVNAGEK